MPVSKCLLNLEDIVDLYRKSALQILRNGRNHGIPSHTTGLRSTLNSPLIQRGSYDYHGTEADIASNMDHGAAAEGGRVKSAPQW